MTRISETEFLGKKTSLIVRRWISLWIDFLALAGLMKLLGIVFGPSSSEFSIAGWCILGLYFIGLETAFGATLGKFVTQLRIVNAEGERCTLRQVVVRSLWRILETNPIAAGGLIAGIACLSSQTCQRIGDYYAKTYVIGLGELRQLKGGPSPHPIAQP